MLLDSMVSIGQNTQMYGNHVNAFFLSDIIKAHQMFDHLFQSKILAMNFGSEIDSIPLDSDNFKIITSFVISWAFRSCTFREISWAKMKRA